MNFFLIREDSQVNKFQPDHPKEGSSKIIKIFNVKAALELAEGFEFNERFMRNVKRAVWTEDLSKLVN